MKKIGNVRFILFLLLFNYSYCHNEPDGSCVSDSTNFNTCCGEQILNPSTLKELQQIVKQAIANNKKIRAFGGAHSSAAAFCPDGEGNFLVSTNKLDKIIYIDLHNRTVKAQAGVDLLHLAQQLANVGLRLIAQPGAFDITVAGMTANTIHDSGLHGSWADSVVAVELVDGKGNLQVISQNSNPEWLPAARLNLGVLGLIYTVTLKCCPLVNLDTVTTITSTNELLPEINTLLKQHPRMLFHFDPYSGTASFHPYDVVNKPKDNNTLRNWATYLNNSNISGEISVRTLPGVPSDVRPIVSQSIVESEKSPNNIDFYYRSYSFYHTNETSPSVITELSVPAEFLTDAVNDTINLLNRFRQNGQTFITVFVETRYVSDKTFNYLSPFNRPSWSLGLIVIFPVGQDNALDPSTQSLLKEFTDILLTKYSGRPVWGNNPLFLTYDQTLALYGAKNVNAFNAVRRKLDPKGIFYTSYWQQRLGPL